MLFAVAKLVGGQTAMYLVVPFFAALLVLATFGLGRRLESDVAGLIGACLVATSPVVVGQALVAMTDVPVAAMWAVAFYAALGPLRVRNALGTGLAAALAVLIRPNLLPLAAILGLHYAMQIWIPSVRRRALGWCIAYGVAVLPGIVAVALVNRWLYGSPLTSGYGALGELFAWSRMAVNVRSYLTWMIQSQTPAALIGAAAIFVPLRSVWPEMRDRRVFVVMGAFVVTLWATYCAWDVFDSWMFLRFMISSWPFFMIGIGGVVVACMRFWRARPASRPSRPWSLSCSSKCGSSTSGTCSIGGGGGPQRGYRSVRPTDDAAQQRRHLSPPQRIAPLLRWPDDALLPVAG